MSRKNHTGSLIFQIQKKLLSKARFGTSRHILKQQTGKRITGFIHSYQSFSTYLKCSSRFARYIRENFKECKTLEDCRVHVKDFIESRMHLSPHTIKTELSSLGMLYDTSFFGEIKTPPRIRSEITRSRGYSLKDIMSGKDHPVKHLILWSGARYHEVASLKGKNLKMINGKWYLEIEKGKNGRYRLCEFTKINKTIIDLFKNTPPNEKVFKTLPSSGTLQYHALRRYYAQQLYLKYARKLEDIPRKDRYYCRNDKKGLVLDKKSLAICSQNLGHQRLSVTLSYL